LGARFVSLFDVRGRINRARYWRIAVAVAVVLAVLLAALWVYALSIPGAYENGGPTPFPGDPAGIAGAVLWFALLALALIAGVAATIRRLHDRNKTGWWILILVVAPDLLTAVAEYLAENALSDIVAYVLRIAAMAIGVWAFVELFCLRGTAGPNRFGDDPLAQAEATRR
jgi:uncharacterized membrane protein YhaH (DUF805 family)